MIDRVKIVKNIKASLAIEEIIWADIFTGVTKKGPIIGIDSAELIAPPIKNVLIIFNYIPLFYFSSLIGLSFLVN